MRIASEMTCSRISLQSDNRKINFEGSPPTFGTNLVQYKIKIPFSSCLRIAKCLASRCQMAENIYWAKVLTDHPKNCDNVFVVQYFGMNFGTLNENTIWHQSCASVAIWYSACSLRMHIHIKHLKCMCYSRIDLNRNSNHRNLNNNVVSLK